MKEITVQELKSKLDEKADFVLIDVREDYEHEEFNIGGELIPLDEMVDKLDHINTHKDKEIVLYCRSGNRSMQATLWLEELGFEKVNNLTGGMIAWQEAFGADES